MCGAGELASAEKSKTSNLDTWHDNTKRELQSTQRDSGPLARAWAASVPIMLLLSTFLLPAALPWRASDDDTVVGLPNFNYSDYLEAQLRRYLPRTAGFIRADGSFDVEAEEKSYEGALYKFGGVSKASMKRVADYIASERLQSSQSLGNNFGLCHGSNAGHEVVWLREQLKTVDVTGTEIVALTAKHAPHTLHWDYHVVKPE